jgi:uncharacterized Fe-S center protein
MSSDVYFIRLSSREDTHTINSKIRDLADRSGVLSFIDNGARAGIKIHFGEKGNTGHIRAEWLKLLIGRIREITDNIFFTDTNVLYKQSCRTNSIDHLKLAHEHGFSMDKTGVPVIIADGLWGRNYAEIEINKGHFKKVKIASDIADCDCLLALAHITGHIMTGFAGAIKNLGMGCASRRGKFEQHCGVVPDYSPEHCTGCADCVPRCPAGALSLEKGKVSLDASKCMGCGECVVVCKTEALAAKWSETLANLQQKMVEYAYGALAAVGRRAGYINFVTDITRDCDCLAKDEPRITADVGVLASSDIVSIDKASADLVSARGKNDILRTEYPDIDWTVQIDYAAKLGMGSLDYKLIELK